MFRKNTIRVGTDAGSGGTGGGTPTDTGRDAGGFDLGWLGLLGLAGLAGLKRRDHRNDHRTTGTV